MGIILTVLGVLLLLYVLNYTLPILYSLLVLGLVKLADKTGILDNEREKTKV